jgi:hypothetical protein
LNGLPPIYIAAMALDPNRRLRQQGQEYYLTICHGVSHGALSLIPITPEIQTYLDVVTTYLRVVVLTQLNIRVCLCVYNIQIYHEPS